MLAVIIVFSPQATKFIDGCHGNALLAFAM